MLHSLPLVFLLAFSMAAQAADCNFQGEYSCMDSEGPIQEIKLFQNPNFNIAQKEDDGKYSLMYHKEGLPLDGRLVTVGQNSTYRALCKNNKILVSQLSYAVVEDNGQLELNTLRKEIAISKTGENLNIETYESFNSSTDSSETSQEYTCTKLN